MTHKMATLVLKPILLHSARLSKVLCDVDLGNIDPILVSKPMLLVGTICCIYRQARKTRQQFMFDEFMPIPVFFSNFLFSSRGF